MKKKVITLLMLGTIGACMLTACGNKEEPVESHSAVSESSGEALDTKTQEESVKDVTEAPIQTEETQIEVIELDPEDAPAEESGEETKESVEENVDETSKAEEDAVDTQVKEVAPEEAANEASGDEEVGLEQSEAE